MKPRVRVFASVGETVRALATEVASRARAAVDRTGRFALVVSGGATPGPLFRVLARLPPGAIPWERTHLFWSDERAVPPDDPRSNFGEVERMLLRRLGPRRPTVHRFFGELRPLGRAAARYAEDLSNYFGDERPGRLPDSTFDLALLGVGPDGHTASVFPGTPPDARFGPWVELCRRSPTPPRVSRLSLTLRALGRSTSVAFLACGPEKRAVVRRVLERPAGPHRRWPAARVVAHESLTWYLDRAAAPAPLR